jgi:hypothetical protein
MAMSAAVPVIRNGQDHPLSLKLGATTGNRLLLDNHQIRAPHAFAQKVVQTNTQRIAHDWR